MSDGTTVRPTGRRRVLRALGTGGVAALAGCAGLRDGDAGDGGGTAGTPEDGTADGTVSAGDVTGAYVEALPADANSLNVLYQDDANSEKFVSAALDAAYTFSDVGEVVPLWIESIAETDATVWEFRLRDNLRWSDPYGALTAEDWVYTIRNLYQGEENWAGVVQYPNWPAAVTVEKTGKRTFQVTLPGPRPGFRASRAMWGARCLPRGLIEPYVEDRDVEGLRTDEELNELSYTGNLGPYDVDRWDRGSQFVATRADDYYLREVAGEAPFDETFADAPYFEEYRLRIVPEESTRLGALSSGDLTAYDDVPPDKVAQYRGMDHLKFRFPPSPFCESLYYNQRANGWELLRDRRVRQALSTAIDKSAVAEDIYRGFATAANTFQPEWSPWLPADRIVEHGVGESHSYEAARSLLGEAIETTGYRYNGDRLVDPDGEGVTLRCVYRAGSEQRRLVAEFVAQELSEVGIEVEAESGGPLDSLQQRYLLNGDGESQPAFNGGPRDAATSRDPWDLLYGVPLNAYPINPATSAGYWTERGGFNFFGYVPEAPLGEWYATARSTTDEAARKEAIAKILVALSEEQPANFMTFDRFRTAYLQEYVGMPAEGEYGYLDGWDEVTWRLDGE